MQRQKIEGCKMVEMRQTSHETFTTVCSFIMTFSKLAATVFETEKTNFGSNFWQLFPYGVNTYHVIPSLILFRSVIYY